MSRPRTTPDAERPDARRSPTSARRFLGIGAPAGDIESAVRGVLAPHLASPEEERFWRAWLGTLRILGPLGAVSQGNRLEVLADGDLVFDAMWEAISSARESVVLNTYILAPDQVGRRTLEELAAAAARGCAVTLIYDAFGSHRLSAALLSPLREAGATVLAYNPLLRKRPPGISRLVRNHWKILVVDGDVGFCGGINVAADYAGERLGTGLFRDTHMKLEGPCVADLAQLVDGLVLEMTAQRTAKRRRPAPFEPGCLVQILESNVRRQRRAIQRALRTTVVRAVQRCYMTTPYFVPPKRLVRILRGAARRGVDVRVLTAGRSDVPLVRLASQHLYGRLLRAGVRIFELQDRTLHAKTATIDGVYASVGSFNLDHWSDRRNLEVSVTVLEKETAGEIEEQFLADLEGSREIELATWERRPWYQRLLHWCAYQLMRI